MISESVKNVPQREYNINVCFYYLEVNMSFATTTEMAEKWNISRRRITRLCGEGRIEGAVLKGNTWLIPDSTEKPDDPRRIRRNMQNTFYNIVYPVKEKKFSTIELFAGAGGLALGVEEAGFNTIGLIEFDRDACDTLKKNRPNWRVICDDIANISKLDLEDYFEIKKGELDLLSGGAPCQAFSYAGKRLGLEDARGTLFYHYAIFLEKLQPKMFLFENVRGLLTHDHGKTYQTMLEIFENAGYDIQKQVLNAWDYGVAQKRERLITIGIRKDLKEKITFEFPEAHDYKPVLRDILENIPESVGVPYGENKRKLFELVPAGGYWRDIDPELAKAYMKSCWDMEGGRTGILRRLSMDEPSLTVLTSPSQKQTERCHPLEARPFTVRENARCQSFPDSWEFCGKVMSQYKQVGNAVPVNLGYEVANMIYEALEGAED